MKRPLVTMTSCVLTLMSPTAFADEIWLQDPITGCQIWGGHEAAAAGDIVSWSGDCDEGKATGEGILTWIADGQLLGRYEGAMLVGKLDGRGVAYYRSQDSDRYDRYRGDFENGLPHGPIEIRFANGDRFIGVAKNGLENVRGVFTIAAGGSFRGTFVDGVIEGFGSTESADGVLYRGNFTDGKRSGNGTLIYPNQERYVGMFADDAPNGEGRLEMSDGTIYVGSFKDGDRHGSFMVTLASGETEEQVWANDERVE